MERGHGQAANPAHVPQPLKKDKKGQGPPFPSYFSFLVFLALKRREREGGGEIDRIAFLTGRAKTTMEERGIKDKERQNKAQRRWDSSLSILFPLSLPSLFLLEIRKTKKEELREQKRRTERKGSREKGYDEVRQGPRARSHPLLTFPLLYHTSSFLVFKSVKR